MRFVTWLLTKTLNEVNQLFVELEVPSLQMTIEPTINNLVSVLQQAYNKEIGIQRRYGGIRNPPMVVMNKIRHVFLNYDSIRDQISLVDDPCEVVELRLQVLQRMDELVTKILSKVPDRFSLKTSNGVLIVSKHDLIRANAAYMRKEKEEIERVKNRCSVRPAV